MRAIFAHRAGPIDQFISRVNGFIPAYVDAINLDQEFPRESAEDTRQRLDSVAKAATNLAAAIDALDPYVSGARLEHLMYKRRPDGISIEEIRDSLTALRATADAAAHQFRPRAPGRPAARIHYGFICQCVDAYKETFGKAPQIGHRSQFQNFVVATSTAVLPAGQGLQGDITRLIKAALATRESKA